LNVVLDEAVEEKAGGERVRLGMVVCFKTYNHRKGSCLFGVHTGHQRELGGHA
jgi:hypothetical protein